MSLELIRFIVDLDARLSEIRRSGGRIGFVPTMGALHAGHAQLIARARQETECVVVSVFVNPTQFDRPDDFEHYPRDLDADLETCRPLGVDLVFAPSAEEMYPLPQRAFVELPHLTQHLCGRFRPGHFRGVATVVLKLFEIVRPERAYFGEKDAQQLAVVRRMVKDLNLPVQVVGVPTVREADGLALSSRNAHLSAAQRKAATVLYRALRAAEARIVVGERDAGRVQREARAMLEREPEVRVEYLEIVDLEEMRPVGRIEAPVLVAGAIWLGSTRLIDNLPIPTV